MKEIIWLHPINWEWKKLGGLQPGFSGLITPGTLASQLSKGPSESRLWHVQKNSIWSTPCHPWLGSQDIPVAAVHHPSSCWPAMVSGLPAGVTWPVLTLQQGTPPSPASIWTLRFLLSFACTGQEFPQSSWACCLFHIVLPRVLIQLGSWWFSAKTFPDHQKLPGVGHQLPLGRRWQPFLVCHSFSSEASEHSASLHSPSSLL